jgi:hypothetical protein
MGTREKLNGYLESVMDKPFSWGVHDCLTFSNGAFYAMYGQGWADDWLNRYMINGRPMRRRELIKEFNCRDFYSAIDQKLCRIDYAPPLGALITTTRTKSWIIGSALGICAGSKAVFISETGLQSLTLEAVNQAWVKNET